MKAPDLERENPRRNDALLSAIANGTGGKYYVGMSSAIAAGGPSPLVEQLKRSNHHRHPPRRAKPPTGGELAPLDDDRPVQPVMFGVADSAVVEIGVKCRRRLRRRWRPSALAV